MNNTDISSVEMFTVLRNTAIIISESKFGSYFVLKGGAALVCKMIESNNRQLIRNTSDLDVHCDNINIWNEFVAEIESLLNKNKFGYNYKLIDIRSKRKEINNSDSLKIVVDTGKNKIEFKIDMNIKSNDIITIEYSPMLHMNTYDKLTMLSDKIVAVSSQKVYRRIKDLYDICALAIIGDYESEDIIKHIKVKHKDAKLESMIVPDNFDKLSHAYDAFNGIENKPQFIEVVKLAGNFLYPIYANDSSKIWNHKTGTWYNI